ncbi:MAG: hypothetical protein AB1714_04740 [Acidobacteriota bacterium]
MLRSLDRACTENGKKSLLGRACLILSAAVWFHGGMIWAQTPVTRLVIDDQKGKDASPRIAALGNGRYAILWSRYADDYESMLYGRVVDIEGRTITPVRKSMLGTTVADPWAFDVAAQGAGVFLMAAERSSDESIVTRKFGSNAKPLSALVVATSPGDDPTLAVGSAGTALGCTWGAQTYAGLLDAAGRISGDLLALQASSTSRYFFGLHLVETPSGFLYVGIETTSDYSDRRAAGCAIRSDAGSATKATAYQGFQANAGNPYLDAAFDGPRGLVLFGRGVVGAGGIGYYRQLKSDGRPAAPARRFPTSGATTAHMFSVHPLTGTDRFACAWLDETNWNAYLQIRKIDGSASAAAVQLSSNYWAMSDQEIAMAYDAPTNRILAAWIERATTQNPTAVWIGVFGLAVEVRE